MKIALLSSFNFELIPEKLFNELKRYDILPEFYISGYNQWAQEILNPNSELYNFQPELVFIMLDGKDIVGDIIEKRFELNENEIKDLILSKVSEIIDIIKFLRDNNKTISILMSDIYLPKDENLTCDNNFSVGVSEIQNCFNNEVKKNIKLINGFNIFSFSTLVEENGWNNIFDPRLDYIASIKLSNYGMNKLAEYLSWYISAIKMKNKKCIVLDADNTLWGGIVGEDGFNGIKLGDTKEGKPFTDFQKHLLNLSYQGIILCIDSKNNYEDVLEVIDKHPYMVLRRENFIDLKINWNDKAQNLKEIQEELDIGMDSIVFIDDNPVERERIKSTFPGVEVPDFPEDPAYLENFIINIGRKYFSHIKITDEDKKRVEMYKGQVERVQLQKSVSSLEEFLKALQMKMKIGKADNFTIPRIAQLTNRTNQFNLTTRRYTETEILQMIKDPSWKIYWMSLEDKFGDNGIVSVLILNKKDYGYHINTFLMSCRVIGRMAESTFLGVIEEFLLKEGINYITAEYIPTKKNKLVENKLEELKYTIKEVDNNGIKKYEKFLNADTISNISSWINVEFEEK